MGHRIGLFLFLLLLGCEKYPTRGALLKISERNDPAKMELESAFNDCVRRASLEDGTEVGVIAFADGSSAKYWFRTHHRSEDIGGTWFEMSDGTKVYMAGYFCCEVQLPDEEIKSLAELKEFIKECDGSRP